MSEQKGRGDRKNFKLPIDINQGGELVKAGKEVELYQDQVDRINESAEKAKKEG